MDTVDGVDKKIVVIKYFKEEIGEEKKQKNYKIIVGGQIVYRTKNYLIFKGPNHGLWRLPFTDILKS